MSGKPTPPTPPTPPSLSEQKATLHNRLNDGYAKIEAATAAGRDTAFLDEFWLSLLREYEQVCEALDKLKDVPS